MSDDFHVIEKKIASLLDDFPRTKKLVGRSYRLINYMLAMISRNFKVCQLHDQASMKSYAIDERHGSFWGYYDKSPSCDGNILYHSFDIYQSKIRNISQIDIILNNNKISSTRSWNWQQGAMLNWICKGDSKKIIHNDFDGQSYVSRIIDLENREEEKIDFPIYVVSKDGLYALSINFIRLARLRPDYGYFNLDFSNVDKVDKNDGIFFVDLNKNTSKLIISLRDLVEFKTRPSMNSSWHKCNHIMLSPREKRFMFFHVWFDENKTKYTRLYTANPDGSDLYLLMDNDMVSHCTWKSDDEIIAWAMKSSLGGKYYLLKDKTREFDIVGEGILTNDGHPSISPDGKWLLTDTYPDSRSRMSELILYNLKDNMKVTLGKFLSPLKYSGEIRCDLHPRFNNDGKSITFDSTHEGIRKMYELDISRIV